MNNRNIKATEKTIEDKTTRFVEAVVDAKKIIRRKAPDDSPKDFMTESPSLDKLSLLAKKMLQLQSEFSKNGISTEATVAYYYSS